MGNIQRYRSADLPDLMDKIVKNGLGMDEYFDRIFSTDATTNYPPYNLIHVNNVESRLEIALSGFKAKEVKVYTEYGKLFVKGEKEEKETDETTYRHRGLAQRSFERAWTIAEDCEVRSVNFEDGLLTVELGKIVPEHHSRKEWF